MEAVVNLRLYEPSSEGILHEVQVLVEERSDLKLPVDVCLLDLSDGAHLSDSCFDLVGERFLFVSDLSLGQWINFFFWPVEGLERLKEFAFDTVVPRI